ncbi:MAG: transposase [bacterium]|nr:transposase [bacterium]
MPRSSRLDAPGILHHVIARGIERRPIFLDTIDRKDFLHRLTEIIGKTGMKCYAWCLMSNHFHLLLRTGHVPLSSFMRRLLTGYAIKFNLRQKRTGHLFQNRYKSIVCEEEPYLLELVRYIHLNPIRAGVVKTIKELDKYPWTGHAAIMGRSKYDWQETDEVLVRFGRKVREARKKYQEFASEGIGKYKAGELSGGGLKRSAGGIDELLRT